MRFDRRVSDSSHSWDQERDEGYGGSPYSDLERPPLSEQALNRLLVRPGSLWRQIEVVAETGSTNADLAEAAKSGAPEGTVLVAEVQSAGRGRLGRSWTAPPRSGLMFSMLLHPAAHGIPVARQGWLPLLTGVAVAAAVRKTTARAQAGRFADGDAVSGMVVDAMLKWPNDVIVGERKLAGILAERADDAVVIGVGLNVGLKESELPVPTATSLAIEHAAFTDRAPLLRAILRQFEDWYTGWGSLHGDPDAGPSGGYPQLSGVPVSETLQGGLRQAYRSLSATLGREVRVELPGDRTWTGVASDVDEAGRLVVGEQALSAGDVIHVR